MTMFHGFEAVTMRELREDFDELMRQLERAHHNLARAAIIDDLDLVLRVAESRGAQFFEPIDHV